MDFSDLMHLSMQITAFACTVGVITDDDKASVLLRALMSDDLYRSLAEYVEVTAPDISFDELVRLARTKNNNSRVQDDGAISRRQAAYSASGYGARRADAPLKYCKHHGKCRHDTSECDVISGRAPHRAIGHRPGRGRGRGRGGRGTSGYRGRGYGRGRGHGRGRGRGRGRGHASAHAANIPYDSPDHYAIAFSAHAAIESGHVDMHANSVDTPGVQGAQHKGSNEITHEQCMRILRKFCTNSRLTHIECGLTRFLFSDDRRNRLVLLASSRRSRWMPFTDTFVDRALRLSAVLHDPSLVLIDGAKELLWTRDLTGCYSDVTPRRTSILSNSPTE